MGVASFGGCGAVLGGAGGVLASLEASDTYLLLESYRTLAYSIIIIIEAPSFLRRCHWRAAVGRLKWPS